MRRVILSTKGFFKTKKGASIMGCVASCFLADDNGGHGNSNAPGSRICICFNCLTQQLMSAYTILFQRGEAQVVPLSIQGTASVSASAVEDSSISNTYHPPPRPLAYDDPRCSPLHHQHVGKASRHSYEESEPVRRNNDSNIEPMGTGDEQNRSLYGGSKLCLSDSSVKSQAMGVTSGAIYNFSSSEDEDVCPTCLEEYTSENPRITMQCSHHFHLACIYEWMERSEACPVCGKVMLFNETK